MSRIVSDAYDTIHLHSYLYTLGVTSTYLLVPFLRIQFFPSPCVHPRPCPCSCLPRARLHSSQHVMHARYTFLYSLLLPRIFLIADFMKQTVPPHELVGPGAHGEHSFFRQLRDLRDTNSG